MQTQIPMDADPCIRLLRYLYDRHKSTMFKMVNGSIFCHYYEHTPGHYWHLTHTDGCVDVSRMVQDRFWENLPEGITSMYDYFERDENRDSYLLPDVHYNPHSPYDSPLKKYDPKTMPLDAFTFELFLCTVMAHSSALEADIVELYTFSFRRNRCSTTITNTRKNHENEDNDTDDSDTDDNREIELTCYYGDSKVWHVNEHDIPVLIRLESMPAVVSPKPDPHICLLRRLFDTYKRELFHCIQGSQSAYYYRYRYATGYIWYLEQDAKREKNVRRADVSTMIECRWWDKLQFLCPDVTAQSFLEGAFDHRKEWIAIDHLCWPQSSIYPNFPCSKEWLPLNWFTFDVFFATVMSMRGKVTDVNTGRVVFECTLTYEDHTPVVHFYGNDVTYTCKGSHMVV